MAKVMKGLLPTPPKWWHWRVKVNRDSKTELEIALRSDWSWMPAKGWQYSYVSLIDSDAYPRRYRTPEKVAEVLTRKAEQILQSYPEKVGVKSRSKIFTGSYR